MRCSTIVRIDAVKIGMVATAEVAAAIADRLRHYRPRNVVLDPVMVAKSGDRLLQDDAIAAIRALLVPLATVITPNLPEAAVLCGEPRRPRWPRCTGRCARCIGSARRRCC